MKKTERVEMGRSFRDILCYDQFPYHDQKSQKLIIVGILVIVETFDFVIVGISRNILAEKTDRLRSFLLTICKIYIDSEE